MLWLIISRRSSCRRCCASTHKIARLCAAKGVDHPRYLQRLVEAELIVCERRMVNRRIKAAKFPAWKSLDSFDFAAELDQCLVMELVRSENVDRRENIITVGAAPKVN